MENFIPLSVPNLCGKEKEYLNHCIETNFVSTAGPFVSEFEKSFASFVGAKYAVAVMNGTAALHLSLHVLGVGPGDEVLVPNLTFIAPINAVKYCGADPIFFDSNPKNFGLDAYQLENWLKKNTEINKDGQLKNINSGKTVRAIIPVYIFGHFCDISKICEVAKEFNLHVIEDASEALGAKENGRSAGSFGIVGCFSFNGNKIITSGGGGMITTNNEVLANKLKHISTTAKTDAVKFIHDQVGFNYRMVNILASIGFAQLEMIGSFLKIKFDNYLYYKEAFKDLNKATFFTPEVENASNHWFYSLILNEEFPMSLDEVILFYEKNHIQVRPIWRPMIELEMFKNCEHATLDQSTKLSQRTINIPCSTNISKSELDKVISVTKELFA